MSSTVLLQAPSRAVDTRAKLAAERLSAAVVRCALPRSVSRAPRAGSGGHLGGLSRVAAPRGGLIPLTRFARRARCVSTTTTPSVDAYDLGWPRDLETLFEVLDEVLGEGSFGVVKAVKHRVTGKRYAVKMLPKSRGKEGDWDKYVALLRKEVALWTAVQNSHDKHVVKLHEVFEDDEYVYLVQDICEGGTLQELLKEQGTLDEREAAQAISGVLHMLAASHDRNICYGDVKPANFLLDSHYPCRRHLVDPTAPKGDVAVKGVDFGCSQKLNDEGRLNKRTGTPLYMAPEIFFGWYGTEVDVWAAGMMLYQLLSGKLPFFGEKVEEFKKGPKMMVVQALMDNELEFKGESWDSVSDDAKDLIAKMLDVDYNTRISARAALQHSWVKRYCEHPAVVFTSRDGVKLRTGHILDFPGNPEMPVSTPE